MWEHDFCAISLLASIPTNDSELQAQARKILDAIAFTPFEQCQPLTREFNNIPARPGIYAVRHITDGLLYICKTKSLRGRSPLAIEVVSTNWRDDYRIKLNEYETLGILEYWIVDCAGLGGVQYIGSPKQSTVTINRLIDGEYQALRYQGEAIIVSPTFPQLVLTIAQIVAMTQV